MRTIRTSSFFNPLVALKDAILDDAIANICRYDDTHDRQFTCIQQGRARIAAHIDKSIQQILLTGHPDSPSVSCHVSSESTLAKNARSTQSNNRKVKRCANHRLTMSYDLQVHTSKPSLPPHQL